MRNHIPVLSALVLLGCNGVGSPDGGIWSKEPITGNGNKESPLTIERGAIGNELLAHPSLTVMAGLGLTGGGPVALGDTTAVSIAKGGVSNEMLAMPSLTIDTAAPLSGGGSVALGASLALSLPAAGSMSDGYLTQADWTRFDALTKMPPMTWSNSFIQNGTMSQAASFNISGTGVISGNLGIGKSPPASAIDIEQAQDGPVGVSIVNDNNGTKSTASLDLAAGDTLNKNALTLTKYGRNNTGTGWNSYGAPIPYKDLSILFDNAAPGHGGGLLLGTTGGPMGGSPIIFGTDATERMRITGNGNVGIGTAQPREALDINGNLSVVAIVNGLHDDPVVGVPNGGPGQVVVDDPFYVSNDASVYGSLTVGGNFKAAGGILLQAGNEINHDGPGDLYIQQRGAGNTILNNTVGKVGIGTQAPVGTLHVRAHTNGWPGGLALESSDQAAIWYLHPDTALFEISPSNGAARLILSKTGDFSVNGGISAIGGACTCGSSRTLKERIEDLHGDAALNALGQLRPQRFIYKSNPTEPKLGFIAEDVPELVAMNDRKSLDPMEFAALLTKVVQEQQKQIVEMRREIDQLKSARHGARR